jgi:hypothetical protein
VVYKRGQYLVLGPRLHHLASGLLTLFVHHNSQVNSRFNNRIMGGLIPTCLLLLISLTAAVSTHPDSKLQSLHLMGKEKRGLETFGLQKRCTGSCAECFGDGYQECASSSSICFHHAHNTNLRLLHLRRLRGVLRRWLPRLPGLVAVLLLAGR